MSRLQPLTSRAIAPSAEEPWFRETQQAHKKVDDLKHKFSTKACAVAKAKKVQTSAQKKTQASSKTASYKRELREADAQLKTAKRKFDEQIDVQAKRQCLSLCKKVSEKLPRELRNMIYEGLITENNATFYHGPDKKVKLVNGTSPLTHCFDAEFTGSAMHTDMIEELNHKGIRFDFRHRHALLSQAFEEYSSQHNFDLATSLNSVGVTLNLSDIKGRDLAISNLESLFKLRKGTRITVFIEASGRTAPQIARSFTRVVRVVVAFLRRLEKAGYHVSVVMNPSYARSSVKNGDESRFSVIHAQKFRYVFSMGDGDKSSKEMENELQKYFDMYGETWKYRLHPEAA